VDKSFGESLREELERRRWTAKKFAEKVRVDTKTVYRWLSNKSLPQKSLRETIVKILELDFYTFGEGENMARGRKDKAVRVDDVEKLPIGAKMRLERQNRGIRLGKMAETLDYSTSYLSSVETGTAAPSLELVEKYEAELGLGRGELASLLQKGKQATEERDTASVVIQERQEKRTRREDWEAVPIIGSFYGREGEIAKLQEWIVVDRCQIVAVLGLGGIGKTALVASVGEQIKQNFEYIAWLSLQNNPSVGSILSRCIQFLSDNQHGKIPEKIEDQLEILLKYLKKYRCLIVLDNLESVLRENGKYGTVLQYLGEFPHQSCFLFTSREKPREITLLEAKTMPVHALQLDGLELDDARNIIKNKELDGTDESLKQLIDLYKGNPLALKLVSEFIWEVFGGDIAVFLEEGEHIFGDIRDLLKQQFARLSELEQEIMYWMAIEREEVTLDVLQEDLIKPTKRVLFEVISSLQRRFMIEKKGSKRFSLHPVIKEYVTDTFVELINEEIEKNSSQLQPQLQLLKSHALMKAQAKEYIRNMQVELILKPIVEHLQHTLGKEGSEQRLRRMLAERQEDRWQPPDYMAGNIANLLVQLGIDFRGMDFSHLTVRQAYLQGVDLPQVNFAHATFEKCVFTDTFGRILSVALSADEKYLAAGTASGVIRLWQTVDSLPLYTYEGHLDWVRWVTFSPDGRRLASGSDDKTIRIWDVENRQCLNVLREHEHRVRSVVFSPDGSQLASSSDDRSIRLWDVENGQCFKVLKGHGQRVRSVVFSPDGQWLASGSDDRTIRLWDVESGRTLKVLRGHEHRVRSVVFSPDGRWLASGSDDRTIRLWDVKSGRPPKVLRGHTDIVRTLVFRSDGEQLASGGEDQIIRLWDVDDGKCHKSLGDHTNAIRSLAFTTDGKTLVSGGDDQTIRFWEIEREQCLKMLQGYSTWVYSVAFHPEGRQLASGGQDHQIRIWEVKSGECLKTLPGHQGVIYSVAFSPDGSWLASGSQDQQIRIWEVNSGECLKVLRGHSNQVNAVAFSPDGNWLASGGEDNLVLIWETNSFQLHTTLQGHTQRVRAVAFSPDGQLLASGSEDTTVRLWSIKDERETEILRGHNDQVRAVAFSPDGQLLASGSEDETIRIWEVNGGKEPLILREHTDRVRSVIFSDNGRWMISGSDDQTIRIWDVKSWACRNILSRHQGLVYTVAFNRREKTIGSGSYDGSIKLWDAETGESIRTLRIQHPYEDMNIKGAVGLTYDQKNMLKMLGAVEK
jgi:WD40 repeat protein/transcriptional regulator with XRE-family HTH domain